MAPLFVALLFAVFGTKVTVAAARRRQLLSKLIAASRLEQARPSSARLDWATHKRPRQMLSKMLGGTSCQLCLPSAVFQISSVLAAKMKSLSVRPSILCVQTSTIALPQVRKMSG